MKKGRLQRLSCPGGGALRGSGFCRTAADDHNAVARERRLGPCEHQLKQEPLFFLGLGLGGPKQGLFGILPELI